MKVRLGSINGTAQVADYFTYKRTLSIVLRKIQHGTEFDKAGPCESQVQLMFGKRAE